MNAVDVFSFGQKSFLSSLKDIPEDKRRVKGVCGEWSVKDIVGHVGSYEEALAEFLSSWHDQSATPTLDRMNASHQAFNDEEIRKMAKMPYEELLAQLEDAHNVATENLKKIPAEKLREVGTIPWYGEQYSIEDLIVYLYYGHKREHAAQINVFKDNLK